MSWTSVGQARGVTAASGTPGLGQAEGAAEVGGLVGVGGSVLGPGQAVPGPHLVPVPLVVHRSEDEDVEDEEGGPDGDGDAECGGVGGEAALGHGEVCLVLREGRRDGDHGWDQGGAG